MPIEDRIKQAYLCRDFEGVETLWHTLASAGGKATKTVLALIRQRLVVQDYAGALHAAHQAVQHWPSDAALQLRLRELDYLYGTDMEQQAVPVLPQMVRADGASAAALLLDLKLYSEHVANSETIGLLKAFVLRWPNHLPAVRMLLSALMLEGAYQDIVTFCQQRYAKQKKHEGFSVRFWIHALVELQNFDAALELASDAYAQGVLNTHIVEFLLVHSVGLGVANNSTLRSSLEALCQAYNVEGMQQAVAFEQALKPPLRPLIPAFCPTQAAIYSPPVAADCVVILFSGGARRFPVPLTLLDQFFAGHGMAVVRLVDKGRSFYLNGVTGLGDSFEASVESLREIAKGYGAKRIITLGNSAGGVGALHYGVALNASHILVYSPLTNLSLEFFERHADYRNRPQIRLINKNVPAERLDIKGVLEKSGFEGQIDICVGEYCTKDLIHMNRLIDLPQVSTYTVKGIAAHTVVAPALLDGSLLQSLQRLIEAESV